MTVATKLTRVVSKNKTWYGCIAFIIVLANASVVNGQAKCKESDQEIRKPFFELIQNITDGKSDITTVDEFLKALPEGLRKNFILMSDSRSFQEGDYKDPRVIMRSPNSDIMLSFNTSPKQRGFNKVEVMFFNGQEAKFEFIDLDFPREKSKSNPNPLTEKEIKNEHRPIVSKNPELCLKCHHVPPRPNWDPYNFWTGQLPFNRDDLRLGSKENELYASYLDRHEKGESRVRHLKSNLTTTQIRNSNGSLRVGDEGDGPGVKLFDQLTFKNFCRIAHDVAKHPNADAAKYLVVAAGMNCDMSKAFPPGYEKTVEDYWSRRGIVGSSGGFSVDKLKEDTRKRQDRVFQDKLGRQQYLFEKILGSKAAAENEFKISPPENRETSFENVWRLRYALEPLGIDVKNWSMSLDTETYTFADLVSGLSSAGIFSEAMSEIKGSCPLALEKAKIALAKNYNDNNTEAQVCLTCNTQSEVAKAAEPLKDIQLTILKNEASKVLNKHGCVSCHSAGVMGAPHMPFHELDKLETMIKSTAKKPASAFSWGQVILDKLNREDGAPGRMPLGGPQMPVKDQATLKAYFDALVK